MVPFALDQLLARANRLRHFNVLSGESSEHFGNTEGLREESLDPSCAPYQDLVLLGQFVHSKDRDDVLKISISLKDSLHFPCHRVMLFTDDLRIENPRGRSERIDGRIDTFS